MSAELLSYCRDFARGSVAVEIFAEVFFEQWRHERDNDILVSDSQSVGGTLSTIFRLLDLYNPEADREEYELDASGLINAVDGVLRKFDPSACQIARGSQE